MRKGIKVFIAGIMSFAFLIPETKMVMAVSEVKPATLDGVNVRASSYIYSKTGGATSGADYYNNSVLAYVDAVFYERDDVSGQTFIYTFRDSAVSYAAVTKTAPDNASMRTVDSKHIIYKGSQIWDAYTKVSSY